MKYYKNNKQLTLSVILTTPTIMSIVLSLSGTSSILSGEYHPPIDLNGLYTCGLIDFQVYNSIPNIDEHNNLLHVGKHTIKVPTGAYELSHINEYVQQQLKKLDSKQFLEITSNNNTLKTEITTTLDIDFTKANSIAPLLGFSKRRLLTKNNNLIKFESDLPVNISSVNTIQLDCNILTGSYVNNEPSHILHEFSPNVPPGYKISETPHNVIYLPLNCKQINNITIRITDQDGHLINFQGEKITLRLHLKPV